MSDTIVAMPEWLTRQDMQPGPWTVKDAPPVRGSLFTDFGDRTMHVPFGNDNGSRVMRAHEMMHARISPNALPNIGIGEAAVRAAEEFRVNTLVGVAGFDLDALVDGSEVQWGKRNAENSNWNNMVTDIAALAGTKGSADYLRGVKSVDAELAKALREVEKAVIASWTDYAKRFVRTKGRGRKALTPEAAQKAALQYGSTTPKVFTHEGEDITLPAGFIDFTIPLARILDGLMRYDDGVDTGEDGQSDLPTPEDVKQTVKQGEAGHFARMLLDTNVVLSRRVDGRLGRRRVASPTGRNPRRVSRMLVDPERRIFDRNVRGKGGIILIDQSGSMHLTDDDLWRMIEAAPGCTIIGYSHRPGTDSVPNVWVLAERGKVCDKVRSGNGGNGVDGPALKFAASKRRNNEPFIWVCDGMVTDGASDYAYANLDEQCARLVIRHGIHMVFNSDEAVNALQQAQRSRLSTRAVGNVARALSWKAHARGE